MRKIWTALVVAGLGAVQAAHAQPGAEVLPGTWECYGPGQRSPHTPPIVFFAPMQEQDGTAIFVDGFARSLSGRGSLTTEAGTLRVSVDSATLRLRDFEQGATPRMVLDREGVGSYRCYRLPRYDSSAEQLSSAPAGTSRPLRPRSYEPIERKYDPAEVPGLEPAAAR